MSAGRELAGFSAGHVGDENVEALVVVEMGVAFAGGRFVQVTRYDDGVARGVGSFGAGLSGNVSDLLSVRRPGYCLAGGRERGVGSFQRSNVFLIAAVGMRNN